MQLVGKFTFDSAHFIEDSDDLLTKKCAEEHGHTYHLELRINMEDLQNFYKKDFIDFALIKDMMKTVLAKYDHKNISKLYNLHTAEQIAFALRKDISHFYSGLVGMELILFETDNWGVSC